MSSSKSFALESIPGVCELTRYGDASAGMRVLIEVPHGATEKKHYDDLRARLESSIEDEMIDFFFINTDVGAPECADAAARKLAEAGIGALVLRSLIPRTFIDCNRRSEIDPGAEKTKLVTPLIPSYVDTNQDRDLLLRLHSAYRQNARRAYDLVCGNGGQALIIHSYAPRSVDVEVDASIVESLKKAYEPERYSQWPRRPEVDLITEDAEGKMLAPSALTAATKKELEAEGFEVSSNSTYRLFPVTAAFEHSTRFARQVLCIEFSREKLADPFVPFSQMRLSRTNIEKTGSALARALLQSSAKEKI